MRFGLGLPTCTAGMMYPVGFARPEDVVRVAVEAEELGFWEVAGNDHFSTQRYVRETFADPPDFFDPLIVLAHCAARTSTLRLMTGVAVLPMRHPVVLAKQAATLDQFSNGRLILGVGIGAYREEFESSYPALAEVPRSQLLEEGVAALRSLFGERRSTFAGRHYRITDLEMYPKPVQSPLPIYSGGNAEGSMRRAGEIGEGWLPAGLSPERLREGKARVAAYARAAGRSPESISVAPQYVVCLGPTQARARELFEGSQLYHHLVSLQGSTLKGLDVDTYTTLNLIGTPDEVSRKVDDLRTAGADHLCGLYFVGNTVEEMMSQARQFAHEVMPAFSGDAQ